MSGRLKLLIVLVIMSIVVVFPPRVNAIATLTISPQTQSVPQGGQASYTLAGGIGGLATSTTYAWSLSGEPTDYSFSSPTFTTTTFCPAWGCSVPTTTLVISADNAPGDYCPGSYPFTVTLTNTNTGAMASANGELYVIPVGPPLVVGVSTDQSSYVQGATITITVTVNKPAEGTITVSQPSGPSKTFSFQTLSAQTVTETLTASQPYGSYTVSVAADDYCGTEQSPTTTYSVGPNTYSASIQLSGLPPQYSATLQVDGANKGTVPGSQPDTLSFPIGTTHTVTVGQYVSGITGVQYYCAQNTWSVSSTGSYTFNYVPQYQLNVTTNPAGVTQVSGGGWLAAGASAQTSQAPQTIPGPAGIQYVFQNWSVDGTNQTGNQITLTMNGPHTAVAEYKTQYLLTVNSPGGLGNPQGGGYHDAGSTAQFSVTSPSGYLIQQVFVEWQGDYSGTSPQGSLTMDGPKTVQAVWTTSYTNLYIAVGAVVALVVIAAILFMRRRGGKGAAKEPKHEETKEIK